MVLLESFQNNFLLDKILVLIRADPSWTCSQGGRIACLIFALVFFFSWAHDVEVRGWLLAWVFSVGNLVEVVVNNLSKVD